MFESWHGDTKFRGKAKELARGQTLKVLLGTLAISKERLNLRGSSLAILFLSPSSTSEKASCTKAFSLLAIALLWWQFLS